MKQKHGEDFKLPKKSERKPVDLLEKGRARKREAINRAQEEESLEEIKRFVYEGDDSVFR